MATGSRSLAILVTWSIWKERNARVFNNTEKTVARLVEEIKDEARLWCQEGAKHLAALVVNQVASNLFCFLFSWELSDAPPI